jgi:hypothetical protein
MGCDKSINIYNDVTHPEKIRNYFEVHMAAS